jgi:hypothetical protein
VGHDQLAASVGTALADIRADFSDGWFVDGVVAGVAHFRDDVRIAPWLHPDVVHE